MKLLLIAESREGHIPEGVKDLISFAEKTGAEHVMFLVGKSTSLPQYSGTLYLADISKYGEYNPQVHQQMIQDVVADEQVDMIVFLHSSYGWDLAPRVAFSLGAGQVSEVTDYVDGQLIVPVCNGKLQRKVSIETDIAVVTIQPGAFVAEHPQSGSLLIKNIECDMQGNLTFLGYEKGESGVDLTRADIIVSGGRGLGKQENVELIVRLAQELRGEYGASRPVVDVGWLEYSRQVGTTGQVVAPRLYIACGISGAAQHLGGIKNAGFVVAINTDREAPIRQVADVMVIADANDFIPELIELLQKG